MRSPTTQVQAPFMSQYPPQILQQLQATQERSRTLAYARLLLHGGLNAQAARAPTKNETKTETQMRTKGKEPRAKVQGECQRNGAPTSRRRFNKRYRTTNVQTQNECSAVKFRQCPHQNIVAGKQNQTMARQELTAYKVQNWQKRTEENKKSQQVKEQATQTTADFLQMQASKREEWRIVEAGFRPLASNLYQPLKSMLNSECQKQLQGLHTLNCLQTANAAMLKKNRDVDNATAGNGKQLNLPVTIISGTSNAFLLPNRSMNIRTTVSSTNASEDIRPCTNLSWNHFVQEPIRLQQ